MKSRSERFNTYLLGVLLLAVFLVQPGCKSPEDRQKAATARKQKKELSSVRLHLEVNRDGTDKNGPITISRTSPFDVNVERAAFLDERLLQSAAVVDDGLGGFVVMLQFEQKGSWLLEQYTTSNRGKRVAIFGTFPEGRWMGAPVIGKTVSNGVFAFTPDANREEAERLVRGLNNFARLVAKGRR